MDRVSMSLVMSAKKRLGTRQRVQPSDYPPTAKKRRLMLTLLRDANSCKLVETPDPPAVTTNGPTPSYFTPERMAAHVLACQVPEGLPFSDWLYTLARQIDIVAHCKPHGDRYRWLSHQVRDLAALAEYTHATNGDEFDSRKRELDQSVCNIPSHQSRREPSFLEGRCWPTIQRPLSDDSVEDMPF